MWIYKKLQDEPSSELNKTIYQLFSSINQDFLSDFYNTAEQVVRLRILSTEQNYNCFTKAESANFRI